ncbi:fimbrial biogenesis outer membrane usher protein [Achromobacter sp. SD115]|uniref:fimbria/pilus outer membrane usher protein n=1 Tax=Achromobacter sp. SD115 TaxID=2782011 RepID=UPI001A961570|nr:fimbria/pilus outer membrane usher protein [Achromobacter sp. SD115]MBO1014696.1 fimbrial biogenesis outer membrane usher protein [Achromobacter sp. SD115]
MKNSLSPLLYTRARACLRLTPQCASLLVALASHGLDAHAAETAAPGTMVATVEFEDAFLMGGSGQRTDLSRYAKGNAVAPGNYIVDLFINQGYVGRVEVSFAPAAGEAAAQPVFDRQLLQRIGVDLGKLSAEATDKLAQGASLRLDEIAADAGSDFDFGDQRLDLSIPQASMSRHARGYVSPELWDSGVNAAMLDYDFNLYNYRNNAFGGTQRQGYLGLRAGANIGDWRLRHNGSYSFDSQGRRQYQNISTYAQREIVALSSQLTLGETYTTGELFDSTPFKGMRLASDDRMLPDSLRGYAPVVRGVANSNARVTIRQNSAIIYETTVAPGAFEITDLYATGYGGDLEVSVQEADGSVRTFSVPYAAVPMSLRPGVSRYSVVGGAVRNKQLSKSPHFMQATYQRGLSNLVTGYAGATVAQNYTSALLGGTLNTSVGAIGVDATQSRLSQNGVTHTGTSMRASYAKNLPNTGTNVSIAAYRYSTGGFYGLNEAMNSLYGYGQYRYSGSMVRERNRASLVLSQQLGGQRGSINFTGSTVDHWNRDGRDVNYSIAYANTYKTLGYNLTVQRQRDSRQQMGTAVYATLSIPLGKSNPLSLSTNVGRAATGRMQVQSTLSGSTGEDNQLSYGLSADHASGGSSESISGGSANLLYRAPVAEFTGSAGVGTGYSQSSVGMRGAVVVHPGGVTLSQPLSETFGIVEAPDAEGARLLNASGVRVNSRGYAVVPHLTPYRMNAVEIDPKGLSTDVELQVTSQQVAPRAGAVAMLRYATVSGRSAMLQVLKADGKPLPFGASVMDEHGVEVGLVGQASRVLARGLQESGQLTAKWGEQSGDACRMAYELPAMEKGTRPDTYQQIEIRCD